MGVSDLDGSFFEKFCILCFAKSSFYDLHHSSQHTYIHPVLTSIIYVLTHEMGLGMRYLATASHLDLLSYFVHESKQPYIKL